MPYYTEPIRREPNHRGRLRLVTEVGNSPGTIGHGFDGDGTRNGATLRLWETLDDLPTPLPDGVVEITESVFDTAIADREAAKPVPPPPGPTQPDLYAEATTLGAKVAFIADILGLTPES